MENKNILIVGVGGQGTILTAKILTTALLEKGYDVKMSEIHGMSQRGGDVSTQVRFGKSVDSPTIEKGQADIILAFEKLEALRYLKYLKKDGVMIVNDFEIYPTPVLIGAFKYPDDILKKLSKVNAHIIDANSASQKLKNPKVMNIVMLGAMANYLTKIKLDFKTSIKNSVKKDFVNINLKAFEIGKELVK